MISTTKNFPRISRLLKGQATSTIKISMVRELLGAQGGFWFFMSILSAMLLAGGEYSVLLFLNLFLAKIDLIQGIKLPDYLLFLSDISIISCTTLLLIIGFVRALGQGMSLLAPSQLALILCLRLKTHTFRHLGSDGNNLKIPESQLHAHLSQDFPGASGFVQVTASTVVALLQSTFIFIGLIYISLNETIIALGFILLNYLLLKKINQVTAKYASIVPKIEKSIMKKVSRIFNNWTYIKMIRQHTLEVGHLEQDVHNQTKVNKKLALLRAFNSTSPAFLGLICIALLILISRSYFDTSSTQLVAFLYLFVRFCQVLGTLSTNINTAFATYPQFSNSLEIFESFHQSSNKTITHDLGSQRQEAPDVSVNNISFSWPKSSKQIFSNLSFNLAKGEVLGVIGPSGKGKSTLMQIITGTVEPCSGQVTLDGMPPSKYFDSFHNSIAYVSCSPYLFDGTIRQNLLYGKENDPSTEEINRALQDASIQDKVKNLKNGLDTTFEIHSDMLSTGEKQRLAIARALLRKPKLLLLDEASANLDEGTELEINKVLTSLKGSCTTILITHRKTLLESCTKILDL